MRLFTFLFVIGIIGLLRQQVTRLVRQYRKDVRLTKRHLIRKILQLAEANVPGEARWWLQRRVDVKEASQDGSAG